MFVAVVLLMICLMILAGAGLAAPALVAGTVMVAAFVAFWAMVARVLIGFARWLTEGDSPCDARRPRKLVTITGRRLCGNPHCGRSNRPDARFCAQCGRALDA